MLEQGLALCRASGNRAWLRPIAAGLGYAAALQGRLAEGRALLEEAISESIRTGALGQQSRWVAWLSEVCRLAGRGEEAWQHARQALDLARQHKARGDEALALHQLGVVQAHADPPDVAQAEAHYQQALALAEELGMRPLVAHCHHGLGRLYGQTGRGEQARAALSTAIDLYRAMDMTFWLPQAEAALAQVEGNVVPCVRQWGVLASTRRLTSGGCGDRLRKQAKLYPSTARVICRGRFICKRATVARPTDVMPKISAPSASDTKVLLPGVTARMEQSHLGLTFLILPCLKVRLEKVASVAGQCEIIERHQSRRAPVEEYVPPRMES